MRLPAEPKPEQCRVTIDSREQLPYDLRPLTIEFGTLSTGDYSLAGEFAGLCCIERKSLGDFVGSCTGGRERFDRELQRMLAYHPGPLWSKPRGPTSTLVNGEHGRHPK